MTNNKLPFIFSHDLEIMPPKKEKAYLITKSDWEFLRNKINKIHSGDLLYHTIGSIFLGIAGSALLIIFTLPKDIDKLGYSPALIWVIFIAGLIIGLLSLYFAHQKRKLVAVSKEDIIEELDRLKARYEQDKKTYAEILLEKFKTRTDH
jgi:hypothetical protein